MNSLERVQGAVHGQEVDYPASFPILISPACQLMGVKQGEYSQDWRVMADTLVGAREKTGADGIYVSRDNWVYHQALGGELIFPEDDEPYAPQVLLEGVADFRKLRVQRPSRAPGMKTLLAAGREVVRRVGREFYIQANIDCGPFSMAGVLRGVQNFMIDCVTEEPALLAEYLEFCTEAVIAYGKAMIDTGVHGIQYGDSMASLVGPDIYQRLVLPYQAKSFNALRNDRCDLWLHICGRTHHILPFVRELNIQGFEVDALVDIVQARRLIGPRIALKGNLDTTFLLTQTPSAIYQATLGIIGAHRTTTGLVVSPGCGVPRMTPLENLQAMARACQEWR